MKTLLAVASVGEALTGLVLLIYPPIVIYLLFGAEIAGAGIIMSRIAGISLIALGVACLPKRIDDPGGATARAFAGMFTYSTLAMLYLAYLGVAGERTGVLLWPAVAVHAILTVLLAQAWFRKRKFTEAKTQ